MTEEIRENKILLDSENQTDTAVRQDQPDQARPEKESVRPEQQSQNRRLLQRAEYSVKEYQYFLIRLVVLLLLVWILFFKIVGLTSMPSGDMYPRIDLGDMLLFYRLDTNVSAQDIVVLEKTTPDTLETKLYVCRVVAAEGDTVEITDTGALIINGNTMIESNIFSPTTRYESYTEYPLTLGEGQCFVLADHRDGGEDSRYFGAVDKDELLGTVITVIRRNGL